MSFGIGIGDFLAAAELAGKVRSKWIDAPGEYASIRNEKYYVLNHTSKGQHQRDLSDLDARTTITLQQKNDLKDVSTHCLDVLAQAEQIVDKYSSLQDGKRSTISRVGRAWKRFKLDPDDIRNVRDQLTATVAQLTAVQNNIEITMIQDIGEDIDDLHFSQKYLQKMQVAEWFATSSFADQQTDQLARRHVGTAQWFLQSSQYTDWRESKKGTLFCPGIPGSGKTIISATIVDNLRTHFDQQKDVIIAYFYCNFRRQSEQSLTHILSVLVRQMFQEQDSLPLAVNELYEKHRDRRTRPSIEELRSLLHLLIQDHTKVFIIIDALDEYANINLSRDRFLDEIFSLQGRGNTNVNLLGTSRKLPEVVSRFQQCPSLEIVAQSEDIQVYLDGRMSELQMCVRKSKALQNEIKLQIMAAANGMFLLARLHFESLQDKMTVRAVKKALSELPTGAKALDAAYREAMDRINQQLELCRELAHKVLSWIVHAKEELEIEQLQEAVAIEPDMDDIDHEDDLVDEDTLISVCAGLVTIDHESRVVRLVHYTTQEFFERTERESLPEGQVLVARSCINYLCMKTFDLLLSSTREMRKESAHAEPALDGYIFDKYKALEYISTNWGIHVQALPDASEYTRKILCDEDMRTLMTILMTRTLRPESLSSLSICAAFNDTRAARLLLDDGVDINQVSVGSQTPLLSAIHEEGIEMVKLLLACPKIDVNLRAPLRKAASAGFTEIVRILVAHPEIDVNLRAPLSWAASGGHQDIVQLLLSHPDINVNLEGPLRQAASAGYEGVVKLLLARPDVDVNLQAPLCGAALNGRKEVVRLLLARPGVDINLEAPLQGAVFGRRKDIVELLLQHSDLNVNLEAPLQLAVLGGHTEIVKLLLTRPDIDVNLEMPLKEAARRGHEEIMSVLLAHPNIDKSVLDSQRVWGKGKSRLEVKSATV